ncbi:MAG: glycine--tRNA ligase subunit beta [bacterium]
MAKDVLLEIGTEEIPAGFFEDTLKNMVEGAERALRDRRIGFGRVQSYGTPRRLVLYISDVAERQRDTSYELIGPPSSVAFDESGNPTKAAIGWAKKQGVSVEELSTKLTNRGEYVVAVKREAGVPTIQLLPEILTGLVSSLSFPKSMRWGSVGMRFARPIRWILALFGGEVIPLELGGVRSGNRTRGHRFLFPKEVEIDSPESYWSALREAFVIVDHEERKRMIAEGVERAAREMGGRALIDENLLREVAFLVEYPTTVKGSFNRDFLAVPREVIVATMAKKQRFFPVVDGRGDLLPAFVAIANTREGLPEIVRGNERVLRARLNDAKFFFDEDKRTPLAQRVEKLRGIVYQEELGTLYDKTERLIRLSEFIARKIAPESVDVARRAAYLAKADLTTSMVYEFPEVQGVMGREYAKISGESPEVAQAIFEQYLPRFSGDRLPTTPAGQALSLAERFDNMVGCFGVGLIPTGSQDPYALRRQAIGAISIILGGALHLPLTETVDASLETLRGRVSRKPRDVKSDIMEFLRGRIEGAFEERGLRYDVVNAALGAGFDDITDALLRAEAIARLRERENFDKITTAFKRVHNIMKGVDIVQKEVAEELLVEEPERALHRAFLRMRERAEPLIEGRDYDGALDAIAGLGPFVDNLFDHTMVMASDDKLRNNRLALMSTIAGFFKRIVDFSQIVLD